MVHLKTPFPSWVRNREICSFTYCRLLPLQVPIIPVVISSYNDFYSQKEKRFTPGEDYLGQKAGWQLVWAQSLEGARRWVGREPHAVWGLQLDKGSFFLFRRRGSGILQEILICLLSQSLSNEGTWRSSRVLGQILPWLHCCPWIYRCMESWGAKANTGLRKSYADSYFLSFTLFFHTFHTFMMTKFLLVTVIQFHREKKMSLHLFNGSKKWV